MNDILKGKVVLFQGDSITDCGRGREDDSSLGDGYPARVAAVYNALYPDSGARFINRGVSGDRTCNLLERYEADFARVKPDFISILIGINDVWRAIDSGDPTSTETFERNYDILLKQLKRDVPQAEILIMEPFSLLRSPQDWSVWHRDLDPKALVVRRMAEKYADYYLPLDGIFTGLITEGIRPEEIALDGVHPTDKGHSIIAYEWLRKIRAIG
ncbi:MAG: SGNH/GDSL hydrolase family protein [Clostridiales bacterium]|jgi:lysophospholipase L1-like esterase|nr:SGNH/GDSL hydrolase family protein [Clostridiales bacterium]